MDVNNFHCTAKGCNKSFKGKFHLKRHINNAHARKYKCKFCEKAILTPQDLKRHENLHNNIREYKCSHCNKAYSYPLHLKNHIRDTHFQSKISCEICGGKLARPENYTMHVKRVHKDIGDEKMTDLLLRIKRIRADFDKMKYVFE